MKTSHSHIYVFREKTHLDYHDTDTGYWGEISAHRGDVMRIKETMPNGSYSTVIHHLGGPGDGWSDEMLELTPELLKRMLDAKVLKAVPI